MDCFSRKDMKKEDEADDAVTIPLHEKNRSDDSTEDDNTNLDILYTVDETPPLSMSIFLGFQHYLCMLFPNLSVPFLISKAICIEDDNVAKAELISTLFVTSGIITLIQTTFGCRLPVIQSGTYALLAPTVAYFQLEQWRCPNNIVDKDDYEKYIAINGTNETWILSGSEEHREIWKLRMREIQGSIMVAGAFELILGFTGAVGLMLKCIGPLCICSTVTLLGFQLVSSSSSFGATHWWICITTLVLMVIISQFLGRINVPCAEYNSQKGCYRRDYPLFKMFPIVLSMSLAWLICFILTVTNVLPTDKHVYGYKARTDIANDAVLATPWFRMPYPGQWGTPTVSIAALCALLSGIIVTVVESVGDYHAYAKYAGAPPPPLHAVNRGIFVEGIGSVIAGMFGTGNGTTSSTTSTGVVGLTRVGSRRVVQYSTIFMIVFGIFSRFGALFVTVPEPVIGASFFLLFGMIISVGLSNLQHVNLNSGRNLFIIGFTMLLGMSIPGWVKVNTDKIQTGNQTVNSVLTVLLSTNMFVGGFLAFILDNAIPGSKKERGMAQWEEARAALSDLSTSPHLRKQLQCSYDLPFGMAWIRKKRWLRYFPLSPTFGMSIATIEEDESSADQSSQ